MFPPRLVQIVALIACVGLLFAASRFIPGINEGRVGLTMIGSATPMKNAPPEYVLAMQAGGALRGLLTSVAFIRAEKLKEAGRYYDALQLATWISTLQPKFPSVWEFLAWNMSWNISVTTYTPEERWSWVYNGAKLLRDKGIPNNPRSVNLYRQLGWTFCNKMSESIDDYNQAYKAYWAWRMHLVLGPPEPISEAVIDATLDESTYDPLMEAVQLNDIQNEAKRKRMAELRGEEYVPSTPAEEIKAPLADLKSDPTAFERARKVAYDRIKKIDEAPLKLRELYERVPEAAAMVTQLKDLGVIIDDDELDEDEFWRVGGLARGFFERYRTLAAPNAMMARISKSAPKTDETNDPTALQKFDEILGISKKNPAGEALLHFMQRKILRDVFKMETDKMLYLVKTFGPVDWRSVDAQGLYWVVQGVIAGGETASTLQNDKVNSARLIFFCLRNLWLRGKITFEPYPDRDRIYLSYLSFTPDENMIEPMHTAYVRYGRMLDPDPGKGGGAGETFRSGHINFLSEAIRMLYLSGREQESANYYEYLQTEYRLRPDGTPNPEYMKTFYDFVMGDYYASVQTMSIREATIAIAGWLNRAFEDQTDGNQKRARRLMDRAKQVYADFMKDKKGIYLVPGKSLPPFDQIATDVFAAWMMKPYALPTDTLRKANLWSVAELTLKQRVYDDLLPGFTAECDTWNFDVAKAFPEPPGMEEYRKANPTRFQKAPDEVETLPMTNQNEQNP